jgi:rSAM/selenodomain-associated transferase 1
VTHFRVALMAKAPVAGLAKTRLVPALGEAGAAALAQRLLSHALQQAQRSASQGVTLWCTPSLAHPAFVQAQHQGAVLALQGAGDLGQRMAQVFEDSFAQDDSPVLLMGTDAPALDAAMLAQAAQALQGHDVVLVPALDGGYALVGLRSLRPGLLQALFEGMTWSTDQVLAQTRQRLGQAGFSWAELTAVSDIDVPADLVHLPPDWPEAKPVVTTAAPGRSCPLHYRYAPSAFASAPALPCDVLYVVGGLYGNESALRQMLDLFAQEPGDQSRGQKRLVFNGDFNWFNVDPGAFERINTAVLAHTALRGNVETELGGSAEDAGCGCAYPDWVGDGVVERSNRIMGRLRSTAKRFPTLSAQLSALPMWARVDVAGLRLAIVHGDAESLAGWGFAQEHLQDPQHSALVQDWFEQAQVDVFASSHTCLPVFRGWPGTAAVRPRWVLNNGATGMPNFRGDGAGLFTRVATTPLQVSAGQPDPRRLRVRLGAAHIDAVAVDSSGPDWRRQFLRQWPPGSDAHASYWQRISEGPDYRLEQALVGAAPTR